jgi:hypothetical protein
MALTQELDDLVGRLGKFECARSNAPRDLERSAGPGDEGARPLLADDD